LIRYRDEWGEVIFSSRANENNNVAMEGTKYCSHSDDFSTDYFTSIEVHHDGLSLFSLENEGNFDKDSNEWNGLPTLNLEALAEKEAQKQQSTSLPGKKKKSTAFGKDPMNVKGVVDAISPILANGSREEPFAIMELYEPSIDESVANVRSAVAVIRGEKALCMHPAIHPGSSITLVGVVSRRWKVPSEFKKNLDDDKTAGSIGELYQRLQNRVPDRVILVTEASAIRWNEEYESANSLDSSRSEQVFLLPSTVESLTAVRGIVKSVHYHQSKPRGGRKANHAIHFVALKLLASTDVSRAEKLLSAKQSSSGEQKLARIYLPKYAMPPNLILGMQPGAILRAVNVHFISPSTNTETCESAKQVDALYLCYVACLRSTLAIERCAGESHHHTRSSQPRFVSQETPYLLVPDYRITDICSDPSNTKSSDQYLAEEKLRRELESKLSDISSALSESSDIEYAQWPTCYADVECRDSNSSDEKIYNTRSISAEVDALLDHHHRNVTSGMLNNESGCRGVKRKSNQVNGGQNERLTMRDPYAEFFDHAHSGPVSNATECGTSCNDFSCFNQYYHSTSSRMPIVVELEDLRNSCAQNFIHRVQLSTFDSVSGDRINISSGWSSSYHYQGLSLGQVLNDFSRSQSMNDATQKGKVQPKTTWNDAPFINAENIYTLGNVKVNIDGDSKSAAALIHDSACAIPLCELRNEARGKDSVEAFQLENNGLPTWIQIGSVVISCLCLGSSLKERGKNNSNKVGSEETNRRSSSRHAFPHIFLPSMLFGGNGTDGHGFVFRLGNMIFIATVSIAVRSSVSMDRSSNLRADTSAFNGLCTPQGQAKRDTSVCETNARGSSMTKRNAILSIQDCLEETSTSELHLNSVSIIGRLVRKRFKFCKVKSFHTTGQKKKVQREKCYGGWTVILSHIDPFAENSLDVASVLQTVEVKILVPFGKSTQVNSDLLKLAVHRLFSSDSEETMKMELKDISEKIITPDQTTLGLAWWAASEDSQTLPLLSRGLDECSDRFFAEKTLAPSIYLKIPSTTRTFSKLGYQRFRCNLNEIKSFFLLEPVLSTQRRSSKHNHSAPSSTILLPYCQNEPEVRCSDKFLPGMLNRRLHRVPPLIFNVHQGGEKNYTHCRNRHSLLAWLKCQGGVPSASLAELHWDICAALKDGNYAYSKPSLLRRIHNAKILGILFCRARVECTQCFQVLTSGRSAEQIDRAATHEKREKSILFCPSGCSSSHAAVKWECSAIIDDGTGQCKLYAERESALLLLGGSLDVASIENGAWELDGGVFFQPSLPASSYAMEFIKDATIKARRCNVETKRNKRIKIHSKDLPSAFSLLPAGVKAEYLLHKHCRQWYQHNHHLKMDLFCRCKPLSEHVTSVNQTEIQVAKAWIAKVGLDFGTAPTASLPPLKLTLEDACLASEETYDDTSAGWNLLKNI